MKQSNNTRLLIFCTVLVVLAIASKMINAEMHWFNFAPLVAISLFSGALLKNKSFAYLIPLAALLISDLFLQISAGTGFYGISQFFVYGAMALVVLLGSQMGKPKTLKVLGYTIGGSLIFWLISNLGVFLGGFYGLSLGGLMTTYLMALPFYTVTGTEFFVNQFAGDLIFSGVLFGAYAIANNLFFLKEKAVN